MGGLWRAGEREADGRTGGRGAKERRMGGWADGTEIRGGRADERTSRGFKRLRTSFPASLSSAQTTRLTAERVCRALGSALGSQSGLCYFFFAPNNIFAIQAQHYCEVCARIVLALSRIVTQNLWRERTILWFRRY